MAENGTLNIVVIIVSHVVGDTGRFPNSCLRVKSSFQGSSNCLQKDKMSDLNMTPAPTRCWFCCYRFVLAAGSMWLSHNFKLEPAATEQLHAGIHHVRIIDFALAP